MAKFSFSKALIAWEKAKVKLTNTVSKNALKYFKQNFEKEGWEPRGFIEWKAKKYSNGKKILVDTGKLKKSIKLTAKSFSRITISTDVPYAHFHQVGTSKMVARPFLYNTEKFEQEVLKEIDKAVHSLFEKSILK